MENNDNDYITHHEFITLLSNLGCDKLKTLEENENSHFHFLIKSYIYEKHKINLTTIINFFKKLYQRIANQEGGNKKKKTSKKKVRKIHKGPRGGKYYISKGRKVYI